MSNTQVVSIDVIRTLAYTSITSSFVAVGTALAHKTRLICFTNNTDGDVFFSDDGVNSKLFVAAGGFKLFDLETNRFNRDQEWVLQIGTQFFVRYNTMPSKGAVYIECLWGY